MLDDELIRKAARKFAVKNALDYGKAVPENVMNKLFAEFASKEIGSDRIRKMVGTVVAEVNSLTKEELEEESAHYVYPEKAERTGLPKLSWVTESIKVNTRFAPNPSGFLHIGHAKVAILCDEYAKMYNGSFFVRFEDTDPKTKPPIPEAYKAIIDDLNWLGCSISGIFRQSERMELYYKYAKRLILDGHAYVCTCDSEIMRKNRAEGRACACRSNSTAVNTELWEKMLSSYKEGEAVLRLKTDMSHPNPSVRDWIMMRVIEAEHPITKGRYRAWPLYNFASAIDDHEMGINLVIRGIEHEVNGVKQAYLYSAIGEAQPHTIEVGVLKVKGMLAHKSDIIKAIKSGELSGWDDPRTPTIAGFRNNGIPPKAIRNYVVSSGTGKNPSYLDMAKLSALGRKLG
jgi:Glutamyl- and glutaminyl-tRNA synthetases